MLKRTFLRRRNRQAGNRDSGLHGASTPSHTPRNAARSAGTLIGGTVMAQILTTAISPILTRVYTPSDFGKLAIFTAMLSLLTVAAAGRYELAIPLSEDDREASQVFLLAFIITLITSIACVLAVILLSDRIESLLGPLGTNRYLFVLPIGVMAVSSFAIMEKWAIRRQAFVPIAKSKVGQTLGTIAVQIGGSGYGFIALIGGLVAGQAVGITRLGSIARKSVNTGGFSWHEVKRVAKRYKNFPLYSVWIALLNTGSLQFAPLFLAGLFGASAVGLYALTLRVLALPATVIGNAVGSVMLARAPEVHRQGRLKDLVGRMHATLAATGAPALVLMLVAGPDLFALVFGETWREAGRYAQWMAPWMYFQFQWSPLSMLTIVLELQRGELVAQICGFAIRLSTLLVCSWMGLSVGKSIASFALASATVYACIVLWVLLKSGVALREIVSSDISAIGKFSGLCAPAIVLYLIDVDARLNLISAIWFGICTLAWYLRLKRSTF